MGQTAVRPVHGRAGVSGACINGACVSCAHHSIVSGLAYKVTAVPAAAAR